MNSTSLKPDLAMARAYITRLAGKGDAAVTFQTFDDCKASGHVKRPQLTRVLHGTLDEHAHTLTLLNNAGAGVYVMTNEGDLRGRSAANVVSIRANFVDLDGSPLEPVFKLFKKPKILVESSPGRYHVYWDPGTCTLEQFRRRQLALAVALHGDPTVVDLPRVMRLPGFYHRKYEPVMCKLLDPKEISHD